MFVRAADVLTTVLIIGCHLMHQAITVPCPEERSVMLCRLFLDGQSVT
jgi:hypothetical protein